MTDRDWLDEVVAGQNARSALIRELICEHLSTYHRDSHGPATADLAEWLHLQHGIAITPDGVRAEMAELIRKGDVSRHKGHGAWRYTLERREPYRIV